MGNHRKDKNTCIQLSKETRNKLAEFGKKDDTFEDIVTNLMKLSDSKTSSQKSERSTRDNEDFDE